MTGGKPAWRLPPSDLAARPLPVIDLAAGTHLVRIHGITRHPHFFGPPSTPRHRFDDPQGEFGVCYLGLEDAGTFAETFLRAQDLKALARTDLATQALADGTLTRGVRLVEFSGAGLVQLGIPAGTVHATYRVTRPWARAFWAHPDAPDGILYRSRFDNDCHCVALFDRAAAALSIAPGQALTDLPHRLGPVLDRYNLGLY